MLHRPSWPRVSQVQMYVLALLSQCVLTAQLACTALVSLVPQEVVLPKLSGCMLRIVNILPTWLRDPLYGYMGGWYGMQGFTGHHTQPISSSRLLEPSDKPQASHLSSALGLPSTASTSQPRRRAAAAAAGAAGAAGAAATNASPYCEL